MRRLPVSVIVAVAAAVLAALSGCDANPNGPSAPSVSPAASAPPEVPVPQSIGSALAKKGKAARTGKPAANQPVGAQQ